MTKSLPIVLGSASVLLAGGSAASAEIRPATMASLTGPSTMSSSPSSFGERRSPGEVKASMEVLGIEMLHAPLNGVVIDKQSNPSLRPDRLSDAICTIYHYCVAWPQVKAPPIKSASARDAKAISDRIQGKGPLTLAMLLDHLDAVKSDQSDWYVRLDSENRVHVG